MRILLAIIVSMSFFQLFAQVPLSELRECQAKVKDDSKYATDLFQRLKGSTRTLVQDGYLGLVESMMAEHTYNPMKKLAYFNSGKDRLEEAIKTDPQNVELRYLRLGIQLNIPSFLGYNDAVEGDKDLIINNVYAQKENLGNLYTKIIHYLIDSGICSEAEKKELTKLI